MAPTMTLRDRLCNNDVEPTAAQLELYKLSVDMADKISARRLTANSFFLTINTGIIAFSGYLSLSTDKTLAVGQYWIVALAGMILSYMWYRLIRSYAGLNKAKFDVIHEMEKDLPYKVFDAEWMAVGEGKDPSKYLPFTKIEMTVPWVFLAIHGIVLIKTIPWQMLRTTICSS